MKKQEIEQYRKDPAISQSFLKDYRSGKTFSGKATKVMEKGTLLDCLLTMEEEINSFYLVVKDLEIPSVETKVYDIIHKMLAEEAFKTNSAFVNMNWLEDETIKKVFTFHTSDYFSNRKIESKFKDFVPYEKYWNLLLENPDVTLISQEEFDIAQKEATKINFYMKQLGIISSDSKVLYQHPIYQSIEGIACKGLLDIIVFDGVEYSLYDFKRTSYSHKHIDIPAMNQDWPFQLSFYKELAKRKFGAEPVDAGWIVYSDIDKEVQVYTASNYDLILAKEGYDYVKGSIKDNAITVRREGWLELLLQYKKFGSIKYWLSDSSIKKSFYLKSNTNEE